MITRWGLSTKHRLPLVVEYSTFRVGDIVRVVRPLQCYGYGDREWLVTGFNQIDTPYARVEADEWPRKQTFSSFSIFEVVYVRTTRESLDACDHVLRDSFGAFEPYIPRSVRAVR